MAGRASSKTIANALESLSSCFATILNPVLVALAETRTGQDQGHDVITDGSLKFIVGSMLQNLNEQIYGQIMFKDRNGVPQSIPNAKERFQNSEQAFRKLVDKHSGNDEALVSDPEYDRTAKWFKVNDARFTAYRQLVDALEEVYLTVSGGVAFEYKPRKQNTMTAAVMSAAEKQAALKAASYLIKKVAA